MNKTEVSGSIKTPKFILLQKLSVQTLQNGALQISLLLNTTAVHISNVNNNKLVFG